MNFNSHVKSDKAKWIVTTIVLVLIVAIIGGLCYSVITGIAPQDWGKEEVSSTPVTDGDGNELTADVNPMPSTMIFSQSAEYGTTSSSYSVSVEATVASLYSEENGIKWSVKWKDENSEWAKDKNIADYVTIYSRIGSDDICNNVCMITCSQAFGETIVLEASLVNHPYIPSVTCEVEYRQRVIGYDVVFYDGTLAFSSIDDELPEGTYALTPSKTTNVNDNDMYLFNYGGTTGYNASFSTLYAAFGAPAISARIVPVFDIYTIEDTTIKTTSMGILTDSFLNTVGMSNNICYVDSVGFTNWLYTVYFTGVDDAGNTVRTDVASNVFAYAIDVPDGTNPTNKKVSSEYAYLSGMYACMKNNEGVWRYTVTSTSDYTGTYTYVFDLGYTESSYQNAWERVPAPEAISLSSSLII